MYHVESIHVNLIQDGHGYLSIFGRKPESTPGRTSPIVRLVSVVITPNAASSKRITTLLHSLQVVVDTWRQACTT